MVKMRRLFLRPGSFVSANSCPFWEFMDFHLSFFFFYLCTTFSISIRNAENVGTGSQRVKFYDGWLTNPGK